MLQIYFSKFSPWISVIDIILWRVLEGFCTHWKLTWSALSMFQVCSLTLLLCTACTDNLWGSLGLRSTALVGLGHVGSGRVDARGKWQAIDSRASNCNNWTLSSHLAVHRLCPSVWCGRRSVIECAIVTRPGKGGGEGRGGEWTLRNTWFRQSNNLKLHDSTNAANQATQIAMQLRDRERGMREQQSRWQHMSLPIVARHTRTHACRSPAWGYLCASVKQSMHVPMHAPHSGAKWYHSPR